MFIQRHVASMLKQIYPDDACLDINSNTQIYIFVKNKHNVVYFTE